eukprot:TRINITY_DN22037_c0_g1_i1.p1 TRINITY_DN22037_c0_g1~~TRINITY_DN22037_c0_g1_i1.p1  ORF type:complete len:693 (-),score=144.03 TRINITY_DN22037_c0_g1_i1:67-2145(-)
MASALWRKKAPPEPPVKPSTKPSAQPIAPVPTPAPVLPTQRGPEVSANGGADPAASREGADDFVEEEIRYQSVPIDVSDEGEAWTIDVEEILTLRQQNQELLQQCQQARDESDFLREQLRASSWQGQTNETDANTLSLLTAAVASFASLEVVLDDQFLQMQELQLDALHRVHESALVVEAKEERCHLLEVEIATCHTQLRAVQRELTQCKFKCEESQTALASVVAERDELQQEISRLQAEIELGRGLRNDLQQQLSSLNRPSNDTSALEALRKEHELLCNRHATLELELTSVRADYLSALRNSEESRREARSALDESRLSSDEKEQLRKSFQAQLRLAGEELTSLKQHLYLESEKARELENRLRAKDVETQQALVRAREQVLRLEKQLDAEKAASISDRIRLLDLGEAKIGLEQRLELLEQTRHDQESNFKALLQSAAAEATQLRQQITVVNSAWEESRKAVAHFQQLIVDAETANRLREEQMLLREADCEAAQLQAQEEAAAAISRANLLSQELQRVLASRLGEVESVRNDLNAALFQVAQLRKELAWEAAGAGVVLIPLGEEEALSRQAVEHAEAVEFQGLTTIRAADCCRAQSLSTWRATPPRIRTALPGPLAAVQYPPLRTLSPQRSESPVPSSPRSVLSRSTGSAERQKQVVVTPVRETRIGAPRSYSPHKVPIRALSPARAAQFRV